MEKGFLNDFVRDLSVLISFVAASIQSVRYLRRWWKLRESKPSRVASSRSSTGWATKGGNSTKEEEELSALMLRVAAICSLASFLASVIIPSMSVADEATGLLFIFYLLVGILGFGATLVALAMLSVIVGEKIVKRYPQISNLWSGLVGLILAGIPAATLLMIMRRFERLQSLPCFSWLVFWNYMGFSCLALFSLIAVVVGLVEAVKERWK